MEVRVRAKVGVRVRPMVRRGVSLLQATRARLSIRVRVTRAWVGG